MTEKELDQLKHALSDPDEVVGPACSHVVVPPTVDMSERFRDAYMQGYRHALSDVRMLTMGIKPPGAAAG
jgi:hypothetical protein